MKPETKRTASAKRRSNDGDGESSPFNLTSMKHAIDSIDAAKERFNLSSLAVALSSASRNIKKTEMMSLSQRREKTKKTEMMFLSQLREEMRKTEKVSLLSQRARDKCEKGRKKKRATKERRKVSKFGQIFLKKKVMVGAKPDRNEELQRWFSQFDDILKESLLTESLFESKYTTMAYEVPPKPKRKTKDGHEQQICGFNTDCSNAFF